MGTCAGSVRAGNASRAYQSRVQRSVPLLLRLEVRSIDGLDLGCRARTFVCLVPLYRRTGEEDLRDSIFLVQDPLACLRKDESKDEEAGSRGGKAETEGIKMACPPRDVRQLGSCDAATYLEHLLFGNFVREKKRAMRHDFCCRATISCAHRPGVFVGHSYFSIQATLQLD